MIFFRKQLVRTNKLILHGSINYNEYVLSVITHCPRVELQVTIDE